LLARLRLWQGKENDDQSAHYIDFWIGDSNDAAQAARQSWRLAECE